MLVPKEVRKIVLFVEGGIGKNIAGTAVVRAVKKQYPDKDLIVVASCVEIFMHNPNVKRTYNHGNPLHFYEDNVEADTYFMKAEPYLHIDYVNKKKHIVQCWCEALGVTYDGNKPDLFVTPNEKISAEQRKEQIAGKKPLLLIQWTGGKPPEEKTEMKYKEALAPMFRRSLLYKEIANVVESLKDKYCIGIVGHTNFPEIKGANIVFHPIRNTLALLSVCDKFIGIDSFCQHALAAYGKSGTILWGGTSPVCLGYDVHNNVTKVACSTPFCHRPNSFLLDTQVSGQIWDCVEGELCLKHSAKEILNAFNEKACKKKGE